MAKVGIRKVFYAILDEETETKLTYKEGKQMSTVAGFNGTPNVSDVQDYGDDRSVESDHSVTGGTLSLEFNELTLDEKAALLGHTLDKTEKELVSKDTDVSPYVGIGAIGQSIRGGKAVWVGKWYTKVQFGEPTDENTTKQDTVSFNHTTIEGSIMIPKTGEWKNEAEFDTENGALTWLKGKAGVTGTADA